MKTKKFFMLLAAVLLSCASTMAQNSPLKGDVNGDGKVDVADIVAILEIMKNGTKELQSIKWASTTAVNGTTGTTPSLGDITLTYNDGTTGTVAYNASGVTLFTDAAGNTPFSNANPGTFNVWAKYCGMMTANSKQVTLSTPVPGTYKYYAGVTDKVSFTESDLDQTTTTRPTTLSFGAAYGKDYQTFVYPSSWGKPTSMMAGGLDGKDGWYWGDDAGMESLPPGYTAGVAGGGAVTYTVTWPTTYYWYVGQTDPSTMTEISPIVDDLTSPGWRLIGTSLPNYSSSNKLWSGNNVITTGASFAKQYIVIPNESAACPRDGAGSDASTVGIYTKLSNVTISGVEYKVYETVGNKKKHDLDIY